MTKDDQNIMYSSDYLSTHKTPMHFFTVMLTSK